MNEQIGKAIVGSMLKRAREASGYAQRDVAASLGLANPNYLSMIEKGTHPVPLKRLWDFVSAYHLTKEEGLAVIKMVNPDAWEAIVQGLDAAGMTKQKKEALLGNINETIIEVAKQSGIEILGDL